MPDIKVLFLYYIFTVMGKVGGILCTQLLGRILACVLCVAGVIVQVRPFLCLCVSSLQLIDQI